MKYIFPSHEDVRISVIGLGYVGLPLAAAFGEQYRVIGFDNDEARIGALREGRDPSRELDSGDLDAAKHLSFTSDPDDLRPCNVHVVAVPTPVDTRKQPDLSHLEAATRCVARVLKPGDTVIYEATVYPGCTQEICVPILEAQSGLQCAWNNIPENAVGRGNAPDAKAGNATGEPTTDARNPKPETLSNESFFVGYSPERINPGDGAHSLKQVVKITSGSCEAAAEFVDRLYRSVVEAGTHKVRSIRVAEAAKVIENTQRDLNIALVNELALIFNRMGIDTLEVLEAAGTKWNFLPFRPGLVGGHCIGVDPYYLTSKAEDVGYHPEVILAGRRINDNMGHYVAQQVIRLISKTGKPLLDSRCLVLGLAFKEDCADIRNTRVVDIIDELREYGMEVDVYDPWVESEAAEREFGLQPLKTPQTGVYDAIVMAVAHTRFREMGIDEILRWGREDVVVYDVKGRLDRNRITARL